jgi:hypothetical protein
MDSQPSSASRSWRPQKGKRPWYLLVALIVSWLLGAAALMTGGTIVALYRQDANELRQALDENEAALADPVARARTERVNEELQRERERVFPLAVATLVLGGAMVAMSARAMSGREGARGALVQVVLARAALVGLVFLLTGAAAAGSLWIGGMVLEALLCLLVAVALTRPGSLAFFKGGAEGSIWER